MGTSPLKHRIQVLDDAYDLANGDIAVLITIDGVESINQRLDRYLYLAHDFLDYPCPNSHVIPQADLTSMA